MKHIFVKNKLIKFRLNLYSNQYFNDTEVKIYIKTYMNMDNIHFIDLYKKQCFGHDY